MIVSSIAIIALNHRGCEISSVGGECLENITTNRGHQLRGKNRKAVFVTAAWMSSYRTDTGLCSKPTRAQEFHKDFFLAGSEFAVVRKGVWNGVLFILVNAVPTGVLANYMQPRPCAGYVGACMIKKSSVGPA